MVLRLFSRSQGSSVPPEGQNNDKRPPILYVEDEEVNWELTLKHLRTRFDLHRATNSQEAFEKLRETSFNAILMDIQLHGSDLNGIDIVRAVRGRYTGTLPSYAEGIRVQPQVPIFFVTAYSARYGEAALRAFGGDRLITKPVDFTKLTNALMHKLER